MNLLQFNFVQGIMFRVIHYCPDDRHYNAISTGQGEREGPL